jgi:phage head maturation protease
MDPETQELAGVEAILQECGEDLTLTRHGYPCFRDTDTVAQSVSGTDMSAEFVIVTRGKDANRNGCMVQIVAGDGGDGLILDNYNKNPVVLLNHGEHFALPLGLSSTPILEAKKATARVTFSQVLPEAAQVFALLDEGILKTASISYLPLKAKMAKIKRKETDEDVMDFRGDRCIDFITNDLLEWSIVTIPADPGAVRRFLELGKVRGEKLTNPIRQSLAPHAEEAKAWSGWTKERDALLERITKLEQQAAKPEEIVLPAKAAPVPLSKIVSDAVKAGVAPLNKRLEDAMKRVPTK